MTDTDTTRVEAGQALPGGWQEMDNAPKDGRYFEAWRHSGLNSDLFPVIVAAWWHDEWQCFVHGSETCAQFFPRDMLEDDLDLMECDKGQLRFWRPIDPPEVVEDFDPDLFVRATHPDGETA